MGRSAAGNCVRGGIGTREIVVGDLIISGDGQERGVVGGTPKLAARLQSLAEASKVVIAVLNGPAMGQSGGMVQPAVAG